MTIMKALSIRSPWWAWILYGGKTIENRDWYTPHRGTILLHASKFWRQEEIELDNDSAYAMAKSANSVITRAFKFDDMKQCLGHCVGLVDIVDCVPRHESPWFVGEYGFLLENPRPITPFPVKGALGFFPVEYTPQPEPVGRAP